MDLDLNRYANALQGLLEGMKKIQKACPNSISTERLILRREEILDCVSTEYSILLRETEQEIGKVVLIHDGEIWYKVYEPFRRNGYATEAVARVMEVVNTDIPFYLSIDSKNKASRKVAKKLGFSCKEKMRREGAVTMVFLKK